MTKKSSAELQSLVVSSLLKDSTLMSLASKDINLEFFTDTKYQFIYKLLYRYNNQYGVTPTQHEIIVMVNSYHNEIYGDKTDIIDIINQSFATPVADQRFVKDAISEFIKLARFEDILGKLVDDFNESGNFEIEKVIQDIEETYAYSVSEVKDMNPGVASEYRQAKIDALGSADNPNVIKSFVPSINDSLLYRGYKYGDLAMVVAAPGVGKTMFLLNEASSAALQGFNVLMIYLGDMTEYSSSTRLMSNITNIPMREFVNDPTLYDKQLSEHALLKMYNPLSRIRIVAYPPGEVSANTIPTIVDKIQKKNDMHFDIIIIDYADNLAEENDSIYKNGGQIYTKIKSLAQSNKSAVLTASQPKQQFFNEEIIPFNGAAESSKKIHHIDFMITLGKPSRDADIISAFLAKTRDGDTGRIIRLRSRMECGSIRQITDEEYQSRRAELLDSTSNYSKDDTEESY